MLLDGGSSKNIISKEAVEKLKFPIEKLHTPYKIALICKGNKVTVPFHCLVSVGDDVEDEVWCDAVPMDACHFVGKIVVIR